MTYRWGPTHRVMSVTMRWSAAICAPRYRGSTTATSSPRLARAAGNEPRTSARPPVLMNGAASDATIRIRFIEGSLTADQMLLHFSERVAWKLVDHLETPRNLERRELF